MKKILVLFIFIFSIEILSQGALDQSFLNQEFLEGLPPAIRQQIEGQNQLNEEEDLEKLFRSETSIEKNKILLKNLTPSKLMRNKIAGYVSRLKRMESEKKAETEEATKTN